MKTIRVAFTIMFCVGMVAAALAACGPAPTATVEPTTAPSEAPTAAPTEAPTAAPPEKPQGGTLRICAWEELTNYNPYICCILGYDPEVGGILQRLISFDPDGNPVPVLATEVPSVENGGLSEDGKTITYKLRPGVKWADGEPMTPNLWRHPPRP